MSWGSVIAGVGSIAMGLLQGSESSDVVEEQGELQAAAVRETAAHNAEISRYDAKVMREQATNIKYQTAVQLKQHYQNLDRILKGQRQAYGNMGVVSNTGSALRVQTETARAGKADANMIMFNGVTAEKAALSRADRYIKLADYGLRDAAAEAYYIEKSAAQTSSNIQWESYSNAAIGAFDLLSEWF
jgi:hypothetical protein